MSGGAVADSAALPVTRLRAPGATGDLVLTMLPSSGADVWCLVRYPPGWQRRDRGWYDVDEELLVLEGEVVAGETAFRAGDYSYRPARLLRPPAASPTGALAVVLAHGRPVFSPAEQEPGGADRSRERWHSRVSEVAALETPEGSRRRLSHRLTVHELPAGWCGPLPDGALLVLDGSVVATPTADAGTPAATVLAARWVARTRGWSGRTATGCRLLCCSEPGQPPR